MSNQKVLVVGYGKMGKIYGKHLTEFNIDWVAWDIQICDFKDFFRQGITHIIIATPTNVHADSYRQMREWFHGPILIEKPVINSIKDIDILDDDNVYHGMCERNNRALLFAKEYLDIDKIEHITVRRNTDNLNFTIDDMLIHDIDLKEFFFPNVSIKTYYKYRNPKESSTLEAVVYGRPVIIDLSNQRVTRGQNIVYQSPQPFTIKDQLSDFLDGGKRNAKSSHLKLLFNGRCSFFPSDSVYTVQNKAAECYIS